MHFGVGRSLFVVIGSGGRVAVIDLLRISAMCDNAFRNKVCLMTIFYLCPCELAMQSYLLLLIPIAALLVLLVLGWQ